MRLFDEDYMGEGGEYGGIECGSWADFRGKIRHASVRQGTWMMDKRREEDAMHGRPILTPIPQHMPAAKSSAVLGPWWYCTAAPNGVDSCALYPAMCWVAGGTYFGATGLLNIHAIFLDWYEQLG